MPNALTLQAYKDWKASCDLLASSLSRYKPYDRLKTYSAEDLVFYDSLSFRYTKAIETGFYFFRAIELEMTKNTSQFVRDQLLKMEKLEIVTDTEQWINARKLRNRITHSYDPDELEIIFRDLTFHAHKILEDCRRAQEHIQANS